MTWPEASAAEEEQDERLGLHWKTRALVRWAAGRAFAWADDEITSTDRDWVAANHPGQALVHRTDPADDFTVGGDLLAGSDPQRISDDDVIDWDEYVDATPNHPGLLGAEFEQRA